MHSDKVFRPMHRPSLRRLITGNSASESSVEFVAENLQQQVLRQAADFEQQVVDLVPALEPVT